MLGLQLPIQLTSSCSSHRVALPHAYKSVTHWQCCKSQRFHWYMHVEVEGAFSNTACVTGWAGSLIHPPAFAVETYYADAPTHTALGGLLDSTARASRPTVTLGGTTSNSQTNCHTRAPCRTGSTAAAITGHMPVVTKRKGSTGSAKCLGSSSGTCGTR
jgi:hypothetical protein